MSTLASVGPRFVLGEFANDSALLAATSPGRLGLFSLASFGLAFFLFAIARWWFPFLNACSSNESSILFDDDPSGLTVELRRVLSVVLYVGSAVLVVVGLVQAALALIGVVSG